MAIATIQKASVMAVKEEVSGLAKPTAGTDFVPMRPGTSFVPALEEIVSDELMDDIAAGKSFSGKESPTATYNAYLKTKGAAGFPNYGTIIKSSLGGSSQRTSEDSVLAGSTKSVLNVANASLYEAGQAVLVGGDIRPIKSVDTVQNKLELAFELPVAPAAGASISKCYTYKPEKSGHPSYSLWMYTGSGTAIQAIEGCRTSGFSISMNAGQLAEFSANIAGAKFYFNPIEITSSSKYIDIEDANSDTVSASVAEGWYRSPGDLASALQTAIRDATGENFSVSFASSGASAGKFAISNADGNFKILWSTGANAANSIGQKLGFVVSSDKTGASSYTSDNALSYPVPFAPLYDQSDAIVVKSAELLLGDASETICRKAATVSISVETPTTDVDSICADSGVLEKLVLSRTASLSASILLEKHEVSLFEKMLSNATTQACVNLGVVSGGNFQSGKSICIYFGNFSITQHNISGDEIVRIELAGKGFVSGAGVRDFYISFV